MQVETCYGRRSPVTVGMHGVRKAAFVYPCLSTSTTKPGTQWVVHKYLSSKKRYIQELVIFKEQEK